MNTTTATADLINALAVDLIDLDRQARTAARNLDLGTTARFHYMAAGEWGELGYNLLAGQRIPLARFTSDAEEADRLMSRAPADQLAPQAERLINLYAAICS